MSNSEIPARALNAIKRSEGLKLKAYRCPADVWTIGYGHTGLMPDGEKVQEGCTITKAEAEEILRQDIDKFTQGVKALIKVSINRNQLGALVSFSYNVGLGSLKNSTLLRLLNEGNYLGAAEQFQLWRKAGGRVLPGLVARRAVEAELFLSPVTGQRREAIAQKVEVDKPGMIFNFT